MNTSLDIVRMAKKDKAAAEKLALSLITSLAPQLGATAATINESKLSLNSVNGYLTAPTKKYFFKFHAEEGETEGLKNSEYYNAKVLADAGWPIVAPIFTNTEPGSQFVVYDYVEAPTAFELYEKVEESNGDASGILAAEKTLAQKVSQAYLTSLQLSPREEIENAALNQLFYKRLVSKDARLDSYYLGKGVALPSGSISFDELANKKWVINGDRYEKTLADCIAGAKELLNPANEKTAATVVGHGDDHNGNRFFIDGSFTFFDTAFAGRQPALLSYIKATAHNVLVHPQWLYDPKKLEGKLKLDVSITNDVITVTHNWNITPVREQILGIYASEIWKPLISALNDRGWLPDYWREYIRAALFCCPFLVLNLIDSKRYTPEQSILALSKCIELGSKGDTATLVETFLNDIEPV